MALIYQDLWYGKLALALTSEVNHTAPNWGSGSVDKTICWNAGTTLKNLNLYKRIRLLSLLLFLRLPFQFFQYSSHTSIFQFQNNNC